MKRSGKRWFDSSCVAYAGSTLLLVVLTRSLSAQEVIPTVAETELAIDERNWPEVVRLLSEVRKDSLDGDQRFWLGFAQLRMDKKLDAARTAQGAVELNKENVAAALLYAMSSSTPDDALAESFPLNSQLLHLLGRTHFQSYVTNRRAIRRSVRSTAPAHLRSAFQYLKSAELLGLDDSNAHLWLAFAADKSQLADTAIKHATKAVERGASGDELHLLIGQRQFQSGDHLGAANTYLIAAEAAPGQKVFFDFERGRALLAGGKPDEALEIFRSVVLSHNSHPSVRHWIGRAAFGVKNYLLAIWAFGESVQYDSRLSDYYWLGRCAYSLERDDLAEHFIRLAIKSRTENDAEVSPAWQHYLGRALWGQGKREAAIDELTAALDNDQNNVLFARWLFQCFLAEDDPHRALKVCRVIGLAGETDVALDAIDTVLEKWPRPRPADFFTGKPPHTAVAEGYRAEIAYKARRFATAITAFEKLRLHRGPKTRLQSGWSYAGSGRFAQAELSFRDYLKHQKEDKQDFGKFGLSFVLAHQGQWSEAAEACNSIKRESMQAGCDTLRLWASITDGVNPDEKNLADPFTGLGIFDFAHRTRGIRVHNLLPTGLLTESRPKIRAGDVLLSVGDTRLDDRDNLKSFRESQIPGQVVAATVSREGRTFEVELDYPKFISLLGKASK